ncbi:MAG: hypothetical protein AAFR88_09410 [Pseudomonadota bacterium]
MTEFMPVAVKDSIGSSEARFRGKGTTSAVIPVALSECPALGKPSIAA